MTQGCDGNQPRGYARSTDRPGDTWQPPPGRWLEGVMATNPEVTHEAQRRGKGGHSPEGVPPAAGTG
eukprot:15484834-Alexandrium_andersonii.AAC.1